MTAIIFYVKDSHMYTTMGFGQMIKNDKNYKPKEVHS